MFDQLIKQIEGLKKDLENIQNPYEPIMREWYSVAESLGYEVVTDNKGNFIELKPRKSH